MIQIDRTFTINAPLEKVWQALTDDSVIEAWGAGPATMEPKVSGGFSLWDGDIHGTNTEFIPNKLLRQDWYGHDHPEHKYDVTFEFDGDDKTATVHLVHEARDDDTSMSDDWNEYYFEPIKRLLETHQMNAA